MQFEFDVHEVEGELIGSFWLRMQLSGSGGKSREVSRCLWSC